MRDDSVFMRDRVLNRVEAFDPARRWYEHRARSAHLTLAILAALAAVNFIALVPVGWD